MSRLCRLQNGNSLEPTLYGLGGGGGDPIGAPTSRHHLSLTSGGIVGDVHNWAKVVGAVASNMSASQADIRETFRRISAFRVRWREQMG